MKNLGLKIFSLCVALLLAFFVRSESNRSVLTVNVPLEIRNLARNKILVGPEDLQIALSLRGPSLEVARLIQSPPKLVLNLPDDLENNYIVRAQELAIDLPPYVEVTEYDPAEIDLEFDQISEREIPVFAPTLGSLAEGLILQDIILTPGKVKVSGAEQELKKLEVLETYPVDLRELKESSTREILIRPPADPRLKLETTKVRANIILREILKSRKFEVPKFEVRGTLTEGLTFRQIPIQLELKGPEKTILGLDPNQLRVYLSLADASGPLEPGLSFKLYCEGLPERVTLQNINPGQVILQQLKSTKR